MEPRIVATLNAKNRVEAKNALEMLMEKIKDLAYDEPVVEVVGVTNEG